MGRRDIWRGQHSKRSVGIQEVALRAGVSITTVSHALGGKGRLTEETRARIQALARELGYRPNAAAQALATGRGRRLALQVSGISGPPFIVSDIAYFGDLMNAAVLTALSHGYWLVLAPPATAPNAWEQLQPDGAVVVDPVTADPMVDLLREHEVPVVTTGRNPIGPEDGYWVDNDCAKGTRAILDHMERHGARTIALLTAPAVYSYTIDSRSAYERWSEERGYDPIIAVVKGGITEAVAHRAALRLLRREPRPDAVYATLDRLALGVLAAARERQVQVPGELLVASLTDSLEARNANPSLTALSLHPDRVGSCAIEMLIALVEDRPVDTRQQFIPGRLIPRASTNRRDIRRR